jgi:general secretion pathway protein N
MRGHKAARRISVRLALVLAPLLGVSGSPSALPADFSDVDVPSLVGPESGRPLWDSPATSAPAVNPAALSQPPIRRDAMRGNPLWAVPFATLSDTRERPIFSASRRPPPAAVSVAAPEAASPPPSPPQVELQLSLVGTVSGGDQSIGIFVDPASKATLRLKVGQDYQGWRLRSVDGREVTMARGDVSETLKLPKQGEGAPPIGQTVVESAVRHGSSHTPQYD